MADTMLDIVDENDQIIGQALRSDAHIKGLRHREVGVWFITPDKKLIFQKRGPDKDLAPNLLDATAGGHVELGVSYKQAALAEVLEETSLILFESDLHFIDKEKFDYIDKSGLTNFVFREIYGYIFEGNLEDLKVEEGKGAGFKAFPVNFIYEPTPEFIAEVIPSHIEPKRHYLFSGLEKLISQE